MAALATPPTPNDTNLYVIHPLDDIQEQKCTSEGLGLMHLTPTVRIAPHHPARLPHRHDADYSLPHPHARTPPTPTRALVQPHPNRRSHVGSGISTYRLPTQPLTHQRPLDRSRAASCAAEWRDPCIGLCPCLFSYLETQVIVREVSATQLAVLTSYHQASAPAAEPPCTPPKTSSSTISPPSTPTCSATPSPHSSPSPPQASSPPTSPSYSTKHAAPSAPSSATSPAPTTSGNNPTPATEALLIFNGPDTYVTPNWYPAKQETHRVVPNLELRRHPRLRHRHFLRRPRPSPRHRHPPHRPPRVHLPQPWKVTDAPANFIDGQLKAIIGFELPISRLEGKRKFNQNRSAADQSGVINGLRSLNDPVKSHVADFMQSLKEDNRE